MHEDENNTKRKATPDNGGVVFHYSSSSCFVFTVLTGNFTRPVQLVLFIWFYTELGILGWLLKVIRKIHEGLNWSKN